MAEFVDSADLTPKKRRVYVLLVAAEADTKARFDPTNWRYRALPIVAFIPWAALLVWLMCVATLGRVPAGPQRVTLVVALGVMMLAGPPTLPLPDDSS